MQGIKVLAMQDFSCEFDQVAMQNSACIKAQASVCMNNALWPQARQRAEATAAAAMQQLEKEDSRDHVAFESQQDSTDQGGDEGMMDAGAPSKSHQEQVEKLQEALRTAQVCICTNL